MFVPTTQVAVSIYGEGFGGRNFTVFPKKTQVFHQLILFLDCANSFW